MPVVDHRQAALSFVSAGEAESLLLVLPLGPGRAGAGLSLSAVERVAGRHVPLVLVAERPARSRSQPVVDAARPRGAGERWVAETSGVRTMRSHFASGPLAGAGSGLGCSAEL